MHIYIYIYICITHQLTATIMLGAMLSLHLTYKSLVFIAATAPGSGGLGWAAPMEGMPAARLPRIEVVGCPWSGVGRRRRRRWVGWGLGGEARWLAHGRTSPRAVLCAGLRATQGGWVGGPGTSRASARSARARRPRNRCRVAQPTFALRARLPHPGALSSFVSRRRQAGAVFGHVRGFGWGLGARWLAKGRASPHAVLRLGIRVAVWW